MSFKTVLQALDTQLKADSDLSSYINSSDFLIGFKQNIPNNKYVLVLEPETETEMAKGRSVGPTGTYAEMIYMIKIFVRAALLGGGVEGAIIGSGNDKGVLEFVDDVRDAILSNLSLGYDDYGKSISTANSGTTFELSSSARYLSVKINGVEKTGYDLIDCGVGSLTGDEIASSIQSALRDLSDRADDGYDGAVCTFSSSTRKFTIKSGTQGPTSSVVVTAGASNDCSSLLGFDNPTETIGKRIVSVKLGPVVPYNNLFPIRYRIMEIEVHEEVKLW